MGLLLGDVHHRDTETRRHGDTEDTERKIGFSVLSVPPWFIRYPRAARRASRSSTAGAAAPLAAAAAAAASLASMR